MPASVNWWAKLCRYTNVTPNRWPNCNAAARLTDWCHASLKQTRCLTEKLVGLFFDKALILGNPHAKKGSHQTKVLQSRVILLQRKTESQLAQVLTTNFSFCLKTLLWLSKWCWMRGSNSQLIITMDSRTWKQMTEVYGLAVILVIWSIFVPQPCSYVLWQFKGEP